MRFRAPLPGFLLPFCLAVLFCQQPVVAHPPSAPSNVTGSMTKAAIFSDSPVSHIYRLDWTDTAGDEGGYRVDVKLPGSAVFVPYQTFNANTTSAVFENLGNFAAGNQMRFRVHAYKLNGAKVESAVGNEVVVPIPLAPQIHFYQTQAPSLQASRLADGRVRLSWNDPSSQEIYYQLAMRESTAPSLSHLDFVLFNTTQVDLNLALRPNTTYEFLVRGTLTAPANFQPANGEFTAFSNVATLVTPAFAAPTGLTGSVSGENRIVLNWVDNSLDESAYQVEYRYVGEANYTVYGTFQPNTTTTTITVPPSKAIEWRVRAIFIPQSGTNLESAPTNVVRLDTTFLAPTLSTATTTGQSGTIELTWLDNSLAEGGYEVFVRPAGSGNYSRALRAPPGTTRALISGPLITTVDGMGQVVEVVDPFDINVEYEFYVVASNGSTLSAPSATLRAIAKHGFTGPPSGSSRPLTPLYQPITQGVAFTHTVTTSNAAARTSLTVSGLPPGLTYDASTQTISGTPTEAGVFACPMVATYSNLETASVVLTLRVLFPQAVPEVGVDIPDVTLPLNLPFSIPLADKFTDPESKAAVRLVTNKGTMDVLLYPTLAPQAVANFLSYVNAGDYNGVVFHRSIPGFIVQTGAYKPVSSPRTFSSVQSRTSPLNEPGISNVRGTLASAKVDGNPSSATHDFFFNLSNTNASNLDNQNGGFTAFGRVAGNGMTVADAIAALPRGTYSGNNSIILDGALREIETFPMNVTGSAPAAMNINQTVVIETATQIAPLSYAITHNSDSLVVTPSIVNGKLEFTGLKAGTSNITVQVTDLDGGTRSQTFAVTISATHKVPDITRQPAPVTLAAGSKATFSVTATGTSLSYQWRRNGVNLSGQTSPTLVLNNVQEANLGDYDVVVSNQSFSLTSTSAKLAFKSAPTVTTPAAPKVVQVGQPLELETIVTGAPAPTLTWMRAGKPVTGQKLPKLSIPAAKLTDGGVYTVSAANPTKVTSAGTDVVVIDPATVTTNVKPGTKVILTAPAAGPITGYQWFKDTVQMEADAGNIQGTQTATLTITNAQVANAGNYTCRLTLPGALGTPMTGIRRLAVVSVPTLANFTADLGVVGFGYEFSIPFGTALPNTPSSFEATGLPPGLSLNTTTGLIFGRPTKPGDFTFPVKIKNAAGTSNTATASISILPVATYGVGTFVGSVEPKVSTNKNKGGRFDLTISDTGTYSGKLMLGAETYSVAGQLVYLPGYFAPQGEVILQRKGRSPLVFYFEIDVRFGDVYGSVTDGIDVSGISGYRLFFNKDWNPAGYFSGIYNYGLNLRSQIGSASVPQGSGYGTVNVAVTGTAIAAGKLADGTSYTSSSFVGPYGQLLIYQSLYTGTGSVLGLARFGLTSIGAANQKFVRLSGQVGWVRDAQAKATERSYRSGFSVTDLELLGGTYAAPVTGKLLMDLPDMANNARLKFTQGGLVPPTTSPDVRLQLTYLHKPALPAVGSPGNPGKTTLTVTPSTGLYSGSFQLTDGAHKRTGNFQGLIIPRIPVTPAVAATSTTAAQAAIPGSDANGAGFFLLGQLPGPPPGNTLATAPILSGRADLLAAAITILDEPDSLSVTAGSNVQFTVVAEGFGTLLYQWRKAGVNIEGATSSTLTLNAVAEAAEANYDCVIRNGLTTTVSATATLTVN